MQFLANCQNLTDHMNLQKANNKNKTASDRTPYRQFSFS